LTSLAHDTTQRNAADTESKLDSNADVASHRVLVCVFTKLENMQQCHLQQVQQDSEVSYPGMNTVVNETFGFFQEFCSQEHHSSGAVTHLQRAPTH
jgi:hypothetical protein